MTAEAALYRLMTWLSPAFPVGAFSYSHGLEWAVEEGAVRDRASLIGWIEDLLAFGAGRNDAILLGAAWRGAQAQDWRALEEACAWGVALAPSAERQLETVQQGRAFAAAVLACWPCAAVERLCAAAGTAIAYPVAVAAAAAGHGVPLPPAAQAYLHAFAANLVSAGVRLVPLGQTDGQRALAALEPAVHRTAREACECTPEDLGGAAFLADIAAMRHETQHTRLFRS
jgi:urease accessory protein